MAQCEIESPGRVTIFVHCCAQSDTKLSAHTWLLLVIDRLSLQPTAESPQWGLLAAYLSHTMHCPLHAVTAPWWVLECTTCPLATNQVPQLFHVPNNTFPRSAKTQMFDPAVSIRRLFVNPSKQALFAWQRDGQIQ